MKAYKKIDDENSLFEIIHDLKTPTSSQLRACELLIKGCFGKLKDTQREIIITMTNSNRYMLELINNILIFSKFKNNRMKLEFETVNLNNLIQEAVNSLEILAEEKNCKIEFKSNKKGIYINGSPTGIKRVITNLISNAIKFAKLNSRIKVSLLSDNKTCELSVINYGKSIEKNDFENIFKKYKSMGSYGNGLGLYISEIIMKKHKSKISVESNKEEGNKFSFVLPVINLSETINSNCELLCK